MVPTGNWLHRRLLYWSASLPKQGGIPCTKKRTELHRRITTGRIQACWGWTGARRPPWWARGRCTRPVGWKSEPLTAFPRCCTAAGLAGATADTSMLAELVGMLGLDSRMSHRPSELSGGQQQRIPVPHRPPRRPIAHCPRRRAPDATHGTQNSRAILQARSRLSALPST
jgi:hypothetical protein